MVEPTPKRERLTCNEEDAIRAGMKTEGFSDYETNSIKTRYYESQSGNRVIELELTFNQSIALFGEAEEYSPIDQYVYVGRRFAKYLQLYCSRFMPNCRIGDKIIMSVTEYEDLRKRMLGGNPLW